MNLQAIQEAMSKWSEEDRLQIIQHHNDFLEFFIDTCNLFQNTYNKYIGQYFVFTKDTELHLSKPEYAFETTLQFYEGDVIYGEDAYIELHIPPERLEDTDGEDYLHFFWQIPPDNICPLKDTGKLNSVYVPKTYEITGD